MPVSLLHVVCTDEPIYKDLFFFFLGVFLGVFMPYIIVGAFLKNMLQEYSFYPDMMDIAVMINAVNAFINPLYAFIKLSNVRQGLVDLFKCK